MYNERYILNSVPLPSPTHVVYIQSVCCFIISFLHFNPEIEPEYL